MSSMTPTGIAQQVLDALGATHELGDIEDGSKEAKVLLRAYGLCLRQLLRTANWDFARRTAPLVLLADGSGNTPNVGTVVPVPWTYEYQYPIDCAKARFIPWNIAQQTAPIPPPNIQTPTTPIVTGLGQPSLTGQRIIPARFVIANDPNYPPDPASNFDDVQGVSPQGRVVILTNVYNAQLVYTTNVLYPSVWDTKFRSALVAYIASEVALAVHPTDRKFALTLRTQQIEIAKQKIKEARITDGNEMWASSTISVDWMNFRNAGRGGPWAGGSQWCAPGPGFCSYGWDNCSFGDGSCY